MAEQEGEGGGMKAVERWVAGVRVLVERRVVCCVGCLGAKSINPDVCDVHMG